jgi:hypothetical protein
MGGGIGVSLVAFFISIVSVFVSSGPPKLLGLTERILLCVYVAWLAVAAIGLLLSSPGRTDAALQGLRLFDLSVRGKSVLLKPNLVDLVPGRPVTTHPALLGAAAEAFLQLGAKEVVAEEPGHQRDTEFVLHESGTKELLRNLGLRFFVWLMSAG